MTSLRTANNRKRRAQRRRQKLNRSGVSAWLRQVSATVSARLDCPVRLRYTGRL